MKLWDSFCENHPEVHQKLITDDVHLTRLGNLFLGLCLLNELGLSTEAGDPIYWKDAQDILNTIKP